MPSLRFHSFQDGDSEKINKLARKVYSSLFPLPSFDEDPLYKSFWTELTHEGVLQASALIFLVLDTTVIQYIWVDEALRRSGIGKEILRNIERFVKAKGCHRLLCSTFRGQGALEFWQACGFSLIGEMPGNESKMDILYFGKALS